MAPSSAKDETATTTADSDPMIALVDVAPVADSRKHDSACVGETIINTFPDQARLIPRTITVTDTATANAPKSLAVSNPAASAEPPKFVALESA